MTNNKATYTIVIKLGTTSLVNEDTREPRIANMSLIVQAVVNLRRQGHRIVIVSSGAIASGMKRMGIDKKPSKLPVIQALASIGQGKLMSLFDGLFKELDQPTAQILLTRNDIIDFTQYKNATNTLHSLLEMGVIPIVNENDALSVAEIKFGDNDTLSAITSGMIHADYLFLMTDVECLYTDNPRTNPNAKPILVVERLDEINVDTSSTGPGSKVGTGGMTTKLIAAGLATSVGTTTIITLSNKPQYVLDIVENISSKQHLSVEEQRRKMEEDISQHKVPLHTRFLGLPRDSMIKSDKKFWLLHGVKATGSIFIDYGCSKAITRRDKGGLLPAGIVAVEGDFHESECVLIKSLPEGSSNLEDAKEIGAGRVNYSATELSKIKGHKSYDIENILGYADSEYAIHRGNLAFSPLMSSED